MHLSGRAKILSQSKLAKFSLLSAIHLRPEPRAQHPTDLSTTRLNQQESAGLVRGLAEIAQGQLEAPHLELLGSRVAFASTSALCKQLRVGCEQQSASPDSSTRPMPVEASRAQLDSTDADGLSRVETRHSVQLDFFRCTVFGCIPLVTKITTINVTRMPKLLVFHLTVITCRRLDGRST